MKMTREKLYGVKTALEGLAPHVRGVRLAYTITYNLGKLQTEFKAIEKAIEPSDAYKEFIKERRAALAKVAARDQDGQPRIVGRSYFIPDPEAEERALAALKDKYQKVITEHQEGEDERESFFQEEVEVELRTMDIQDFESDKAVVPDAPGLAPFFFPLMEAGVLIEAKKAEKPE